VTALAFTASEEVAGVPKNRAAWQAKAHAREWARENGHATAVYRVLHEYGETFHALPVEVPRPVRGELQMVFDVTGEFAHPTRLPALIEDVVGRMAVAA
jgi:hypothetical protein